MKSFNEHITSEKEDGIRVSLKESIIKSLSFDVYEVRIDGSSRSDIKRYVNREDKDRTYGFIFKLNLHETKDVAKQLLEIDKILNTMFGNNTYSKNKVVGDREYTQTSSNPAESSDQNIDGKATRVHLPVVEYWYDPEVIENSKIFKTLSQIDKYKL